MSEGYERTDPYTLAYTLSEHVADTEQDPQGYLVEFMDELFTLEPGARQHFADTLLTELKEEISRNDTDFGYACRNAIVLVEQDWRNRA